MIMEIEYVCTTHNECYFKLKDNGYCPSGYIPVKHINKLSLGRYQVEYYDKTIEGKEGETNSLKILYPSAIEEVKYILK